MQAKSILTAAALVLAALFILDVPAANASVYTWTGSTDTEWDDPNNWNPSTGYPDGTDDKAIIADVATDPILDMDITVGAVRIEDGGHLTVTADSRVTLTIQKEAKPGDGTGILIIETNGTPGQLTIGDNGTVHLDSAVTQHEIAGQIHLTASTSILHVDETVTLDGHNDGGGMDYGTIDGQNDSAQITIAASKTLTNEITIAGAMEIWAGSGTFINGATGLVHANRTSGGQILTLYSGTFDDVDGAEWKVSGHAAAELYFRAGITVGTLDGDFTVSNGILDLDVSVTTNGGLCFTGGRIEVASGCTFTASGSHPSCP